MLRCCYPTRRPCHPLSCCSRTTLQCGRPCNVCTLLHTWTSWAVYAGVCRCAVAYNGDPWFLALLKLLVVLRHTSFRTWQVGMGVVAIVGHLRCKYKQHNKAPQPSVAVHSTQESPCCVCSQAPTLVDDSTYLAPGSFQAALEASSRKCRVNQGGHGRHQMCTQCVR